MRLELVVAILVAGCSGDAADAQRSATPTSSATSSAPAPQAQAGWELASARRVSAASGRAAFDVLMRGTNGDDYPLVKLRIHADVAIGKSLTLDGFESNAQRCEAEDRCTPLPEARALIRTRTQDLIEGDLYWQRPDKSGEYVVPFSAAIRRPGGP